MNKYLWLLIIVFISFHQILRGENIVIAYEDKEQPPYYLGSGGLIPENYPGIAVEMVQMLEESIEGLTIELVRLPWPRCLYSLGNNLVDGIFNASYSRDRLEIGWYPTLDGTHEGEVDKSRSMAVISYSLYKKADAMLDWNGTLFTGYSRNSLGAPLGYSIVGDLARSGYEVFEFQSTEGGFLMLENRRLEGIVVQDITGDSILRSNSRNYGDIIKVTPPVVTKEYYLMLSDQLVRSDRDLAERIWTEISVSRERDFADLEIKYSGFSVEE
ncbi:MAG: transporter substrate-binding domain-containing protein [Spirochaetales bacterium]|nr:transporter substrate-binding domain-containing protein [Spirochaetales bacterium]